MPWLIRLLFHARARLLFRECAAYTLAEYGDAAAAKLLGEIDRGTPLSGRLPIWLMIAEVRRQARGGVVPSGSLSPAGSIGSVMPPA
jgi:hypothetical protein